MRVTVRNYMFPFREDLGAWAIIWDELRGRDGYVRLQATLSPDLKKMVDYLVDKRFLNRTNAQMVYTASTLGISIPADVYTVNVIKGVIKFVKSKTQVIKKSSYSWLGALDMGNTCRTDKCMKAIKKDLVLDGEETLGSHMVSFLNSSGINLRRVY